MVLIIFRLWPILLPIAIGIFVFIADEPIWKKLGLILLPTIIIIIGYNTSNYSISILCHFSPVILLIVLLIYYRNRGVI